MLHPSYSFPSIRLKTPLLQDSGKASGDYGTIAKSPSAIDLTAMSFRAISRDEAKGTGLDGGHTINITSSDDERPAPLLEEGISRRIKTTSDVEIQVDLTPPAEVYPAGFKPERSLSGMPLERAHISEKTIVPGLFPTTTPFKAGLLMLGSSFTAGLSLAVKDIGVQNGDIAGPEFIIGSALQTVGMIGAGVSAIHVAHNHPTGLGKCTGALVQACVLSMGMTAAGMAGYGVGKLGQSVADLYQ